LLMEFFALNHLMKHHQEHVNVEGYPIVEQALAKGKGVIFVGLHMGNWEMLLPFAAEKGHYAALVTTNVPDERLNELIRQHRQRGNLELIPRGDPQTMRKILNCFKRNGILFLAVDQDTNVPSIWAPFFGMLAKTPVSVARFAMKTGAPVLGFTTLRQLDGSFEVKIYDWGSFHSESKVLEEDLYRVTRWINQRIEELIRIDPPQWAWFHRRWRHPASAEDEAFSLMMEQKLAGGLN
ncbi:MAG: lysophospholipid acyltransferase family protein, partial [SAR324 cluster bacterium]|nr:lysophospholipid acyltransferase family protein [SAR324 cluster bacterium]